VRPTDYAKNSHKDSSAASEYRKRDIKTSKKAKARGQARRENMKDGNKVGDCARVWLAFFM